MMNLVCHVRDTKCEKEMQKSFNFFNGFMNRQSFPEPISDVKKFSLIDDGKFRL